MLCWVLKMFFKFWLSYFSALFFSVLKQYLFIYLAIAVYVLKSHDIHTLGLIQGRGYKEV